MANKKPSINDIAKHLSVTKSTVSFIINGKAEAHRISKKQEQRVLEYIKEIGYTPNYMAKSLATGKTNSIGLIVENIGDSFFGLGGTRF
ncbi:LacI family transcriptional regulator [Sphingobacterium phlebotomi]|uniref:LacI family transcriptional regulator n=1 Tax=Sphingobacterium phlebotomi TaxID=2605433 RepID=A0A5D4H8R8_9SPHI|nr:LacI family DNA-binding transcriptional regulator [Sphingobacterium phlebotomi]TYR36964.1 LacI family transcriptional regulator [Sphingobacterium phlebotomi]